MVHKAFLIVGHRHWGKSETLRSLTGGNRSIFIDGIPLSVRRMSNDDIDKDDPEKFWRFTRDLSEPYVAIAFCPTFDSDPQFTRYKLDAATILDALRKHYEIFFWVIKHSQNPKRKRPREIDEPTIERLKTYGTVKIFARKQATPQELAADLKHFIENHLSNFIIG